MVCIHVCTCLISLNTFDYTLKSLVPFTEAVLVQLYRIASSPNAFPAVIFPKTLLFFRTSNSPSVDKYNTMFLFITAKTMFYICNLLYQQIMLSSNTFSIMHKYCEIH